MITEIHTETDAGCLCAECRHMMRLMACITARDVFIGIGMGIFVGGMVAGGLSLIPPTIGLAVAMGGSFLVNKIIEFEENRYHGKEG